MKFLDTKQIKTKSQENDDTNGKYMRELFKNNSNKPNLNFLRHQKDFLYRFFY